MYKKLFVLVISYLVIGCVPCNTRSPVVLDDSKYYVWVRVPVKEPLTRSGDSSNSNSVERSLFLTNATSKDLEIGPIFIRQNESINLSLSREKFEFVKGDKFEKEIQKRNLHIRKYKDIGNILVIKEE